MMRKLLPALLMPALLMPALLLPAASAVAAEGPPPAICGSPAVLGFVAERLHRAGQAVTIEAGPVGQSPGSRVDLVHCAVRVHTLVYDTARLGAAPADRVSVYRFMLDLRHNAIFLSDDP